MRPACAVRAFWSAGGKTAPPYSVISIPSFVHAPKNCRDGGRFPATDFRPMTKIFKQSVFTGGRGSALPSGGSPTLAPSLMIARRDDDLASRPALRPTGVSGWNSVPPDPFIFGCDRVTIRVLKCTQNQVDTAAYRSIAYPSMANQKDTFTEEGDLLIGAATAVAGKLMDESGSPRWAQFSRAHAACYRQIFRQLDKIAACVSAV